MRRSIVAGRASLVPLLGLAFATLALSCTGGSWRKWTGDPYELDSVSRTATSAKPLTCHPELLEIYRGETVRLEPPVSVAAPFRPRVARFEALVATVGERVYGRAPSRILNAGAYACRAVEHRSGRLSEHALGNALDVTGFRFPPLQRAQSGAAGAAIARQELPRNLERGFTVTVARHFREPSGTADAVTRKHHEFFVELAEALRRNDIFRGMLGPSDPRHATHLHLDMGPWSYERL